MIHFISGKPGGGKSLFATRIVVDELALPQWVEERGQKVRCRRYVVTNLALQLAELQEYLHINKGIECHVADWVTLLDEEQMRRFFLYRGGERILPAPDDRERMPDYSSISSDGGPSVTYVLDELHLFFNAREWEKTGKWCLHYLSQHRKLGDEVYAVTQFVMNVDKQFRSVAQDFTYVRNERLEKVGPFRRSNNFVAVRYQAIPGIGVPMDGLPERFPLDLELAGCFDTAAGVGIRGGGGADRGKRAKGADLKRSLVVLAVVALFGAWLAIKGVRSMGHHLMARTVGSIAEVRGSPTPKGEGSGKRPPFSVKGEMGPLAVVSDKENDLPAGSESPNVFWQCFEAFGAQRALVLSDGRVVTGQDVLEVSGDVARVRWKGGEKALFRVSIQSVPDGASSTRKVETPPTGERGKSLSVFSDKK